MTPTPRSRVAHDHPTVGERRIRRLLVDETGSAGISSYFAVITMLLLLGLGVAGMRVFTGFGDVSAAARAGARAAAIEHDHAAAASSVQAVVADELARTGAACTNATATLDTPAGDFGPGQVATVTVTCDVSFVGLFVPWATIAEKQITATGVEPIDCLRGQWPTEAECQGF
ncbi:MAG: hypothetical protein AAF467_17610 [Actinomycetota bacterium]